MRLTPGRLQLDEKKNNYTLLKKFDLWLKKNNINLEVEEFLILVCILASIVIIVGIINFPNPIIAILLAIILIFVLFILINIRRQRENQKKEKQLEQFLLDLKGNLYGSPNLLTSLEKTIPGLEDPLRKDLEIVLNDIRKGLIVDEAIKKMIERSSSYLVETTLTGLIVANKEGADLLVFISDQIEYLREKRNIENYIKIISSGPKHTAYIIMIIPVLVILILMLINKTIAEMLFSRSGMTIISYVLVSNALGIFFINRLVNLTNEGKY